MLWIPLKQKPGMGTILNAFIIALTIEFSIYFLPYPEYYPLKILQVIIGVIIFALGIGPSVALGITIVGRFSKKP